MTAEKLLEKALASGATDAEVYHVKSFSRPIIFEANRLKQLETNQSEGYALRLWREGCPGLAVAFGEVETEILVEKAMALSHLNPPEIIEINSNNTLIHPPSGKTLPIENMMEIGKEAIAQIRDAYPETICSAEFECEEETTTLINSKGLHCQYTDISLSYFLGVELIRGEDFLGIYDGEYTKNQINTKNTVESILKRLHWAESNTKSPQGKIPILFTANAATMLWSTIADALSGKRVLEKSSPWSESLGELVMDSQLNLSQTPDIGPYSCPFDDEGTPTQILELISQGKVNQFYSDRVTARELGKQTTGNGFRPGLGRYPTPDLVNLLIEPGKSTLAELIESLDEGLMIDQILGGGADISGDFSVNVELGYGVKEGKIVGRVKDTMIAGNVYTALKELIALGKDIQWSGSCHTPSLIVGGLSVVA